MSPLLQLIRHNHWHGFIGISFFQDKAKTHRYPSSLFS
jgi:hypothetical protein